MSRILKVAFWPEEKKVGCAKIQRQFNCDPAIAGLFPTDMVTMKVLNSPVYIYEATETQWKKIAIEWSRIDERDSRWTKSSMTH